MRTKTSNGNMHALRRLAPNANTHLDIIGTVVVLLFISLGCLCIDSHDRAVGNMDVVPKLLVTSFNNMWNTADVPFIWLLHLTKWWWCALWVQNSIPPSALNNLSSILSWSDLNHQLHLHIYHNLGEYSVTFWESVLFSFVFSFIYDYSLFSICRFCILSCSCTRVP